jgi:hypothetical protein
MAKEKEKLIMKLDNLKIKNLRKKAFSDSSHDQLFNLYNCFLFFFNQTKLILRR